LQIRLLEKNFRKLVSPVLSKLDILPEFGMFHSALMIGPWLIEWNNSALSIPRKCVSRAALLSADIDSISTDKKLEEVIDTLSECICEWNTTKQYKDNPKNKKIEGNCQDFVQDILDRLKIKTDFKGPLGETLRKLREEGKSEMEFIMDNDFRETFGILETKITFNKHCELDTFVKKLLTKELEFEIKYRNEWALLKSYDRAFWLRYFKFKNDDRWIPLKQKLENKEGEVDFELCCPFGDPEETCSIRFIKENKT